MLHSTFVVETEPPKILSGSNKQTCSFKTLKEFKQIFVNYIREQKT